MTKARFTYALTVAICLSACGDSGGGDSSTSSSSSSSSNSSSSSSSASSSSGSNHNVDNNEPYLPESIADTIVHPYVQYQTHQGFGTSLAWFGNVIGGWQDVGRNAIVDLLFDREQGLGLNIVRYNIGGGENPNHDHMRPGGEMEGFQPSEGQWDWSADARQRWVLNAAKERAGEDFFVEAFSNSPPYWMTYSQCAAGNDPGSSDALRSDRYDDFADYLVKVALQFKNEWGITFDTIEPVNEPEANWWKAFNVQEGARFGPSSQAKIVDELAASLQKHDADFDIAAMDASGIGEALDNYEAYGSTTRSRITQINAHGYHGSAQQRYQLRNLAKSESKRLWMSESDGGGLEDAFAANTHNPDSMGPALDLSRRLYQVLRELQPDGWVFWQAVESWPNQISIRKNWGLILADFGKNGSSNSHYRTTKKYYTMAQYSKHILPGSTMIAINDPTAVAFLLPEDKGLVIVKTNTSNQTTSFEVDLSRFENVSGSPTVYRTSANENHEQINMAAVDSPEILDTDLPAQSITTFVFANAAPKPERPVNGTFLVVNENSGKCLAAGAQGIEVRQYTCNEQNPSQHWQITASAEGTYHFENVQAGEVMAIDGDIFAAARQTSLGSANGDTQWRIIKQSEENYLIEHATSLLVLDINSASREDDAPAIQWYPNGGDNQKWRLQMLN